MQKLDLSVSNLHFDSNLLYLLYRFIIRTNVFFYREITPVEKLCLTYPNLTYPGPALQLIQVINYQKIDVATLLLFIWPHLSTFTHGK